MAAQIRYLKIATREPETVADFYVRHLSMSELGRSDHGDIALTDGHYNLTFLRVGEGAEEGLKHYGIAVDDIGHIEERARAFSPWAKVEREPGGVCHGEYRVFDPNGIPISLSLESFHVDDAVGRLPGIHHIALSVGQNELALRFLVDVFGFRETSTSKLLRDCGQASRFAGDGATAVAILQYPVVTAAVEGRLGPRHTKSGLNHFGFLVPDLEACLAGLPEGSVERRPPRPFTEYRVLDPDGNEFDVSESKGYEIDTEVWLSALDGRTHLASAPGASR